MRIYFEFIYTYTIIIRFIDIIMNPNYKLLINNIIINDNNNNDNFNNNYIIIIIW